MSEFGGAEILGPDEGAGGASEALNEQAKQKFAAAAAVGQQARKQEQKSRKRDERIAQAIIVFLTDAQRTHLATLISRLVSRNCPSPFILAILSLINTECLKALQDYLKESLDTTADTVEQERRQLLAASDLNAEANRELLEWMTRLELAMELDPRTIITSLLIDPQTFDATPLQLTAVVLGEFLKGHGKGAAPEKLQQLSAVILQSVFAPHIERMANESSSEPQVSEE